MNNSAMTTREGERRYDRANLRSIIPGGLLEWDYWSLKYALGLTVHRGNTDQFEYYKNLINFLQKLVKLRVSYSSFHRYIYCQYVDCITFNFLILKIF